MIPSDSTAHLVALGKVVSNGQAFEVRVAQALALVLELPPESGRAAARRLGLVGSIALIGELTPNDASLQEWVQRADRARIARNQVTHSPWFHADDSEVDGFLDLRRERAVPVEDSVQHLEEVVALLRDALDVPGLTPI